MDFKDNKELINKINTSLGDFCKTFQNARKDYLGLTRMASRSAVFTFNNDSRDWAINHGGGSEIQYHIYRHGDEFGYGIGFNAQYVPFHNDKSSVDYIMPYIRAFLSDYSLETNLLENDFEYIEGNHHKLSNIKNGEYVLLGKRITLTQKKDGYNMNDKKEEEMISDMKGLMFETYKKVFESKSNFENTSFMIENIIKILKYKKQIVMQGPPGTGKTYTAKNIAERIIFSKEPISIDKQIQKEKLDQSVQFKLVQFHPSYSYEDFIRGISAKSEGEQITYETENKTLAAFAQEAFNNLKASKKDPEDFSKEEGLKNLLMEFAEKIQDTIDEQEIYKITEAVSIVAVEDDAFRYTGKWKTSQRMKFKDLISALLQDVNSRRDFKSLGYISGLAKQHSTYFFKVIEQFRKEFGNQINEAVAKTVSKPKLKNYVLIIDEINRANLPSVLGELIYALEYRGEAVDSMYAIDGDAKIIIPENLYIIGTMNTADRSVGHIDYAIKRRFAFVDVPPNVDIIANDRAKVLFNLVSELFTDKYLASDFDSKDVHLGHSYFLLDEFSELSELEQLKLKLNYEIVPILTEYVRDGLLLETAKDKIKEISGFEC